MKFNLNNFLDWNRFQGAKENAIDKIEEYWKQYEGMSYEEVCKREPYVLKEWFMKEEK